MLGALEPGFSHLTSMMSLLGGVPGLRGILANLPGITLWVTLFTGDRLRSIEGLLLRLGFVVVLIWVAFAVLHMLSTTSGLRRPA